MKRFLILLLIIIGASLEVCLAQSYLPPFATYTPVLPVTQRNLSQIILDDGNYKVDVEYESDTGHRAHYKLVVEIQNDYITTIFFGNGGSVHSGYNNSGYTYRGGGVHFDSDFDGNITRAYAKIQVDYSNGSWQYFTIYL